MNGDRRTAFCRPTVTDSSPHGSIPDLRPRRVAQDRSRSHEYAPRFLWSEPVPAPGVDRSRDSVGCIGIPPGAG